MDIELKEYIKNCPKAELHYHIDCISPELFVRFSKRNHMELPFCSVKEQTEFYSFHNLKEFLNVMQKTIASIQTKQDFSDMIVDCVKDMKRQNIIYREAMFDYTSCYGRRGISLQTMIEGFSDGLERAKKQFGEVDLRFIANIDRTQEVETNCKYLQELNKYKDEIPLIGIGMDMDEQGYPAHDQKEVFLLAKKYGFYLTGHHGEEAGTDYVKDALDSLQLDRIDHGVRAVEDEWLMDFLAQKNMLLTLCPESNVRLGVYSSWEEYPLRKFMEKAVKVCINSDDPGAFGCDLTQNLIKCAEVFHLTKMEIKELIQAPFVYNFVPVS